MGKTGMVISYHINKTYIAKVLCENKEVPQMQCNGKCQLKKQLVAEETKKESEPVSVENLPEVFWTMAQEEQAEKQFPTYCTNSPIVSIFQSTNFPSSIFHPPTVG
jgi:hypothetical protein